MDTNRALLVSHPAGEVVSVPSSVGVPSLFVDTFAGRVHVEWDPQAAVTPLGQLPFFVDFLKTSELFQQWVDACPVSYTSPNAPKLVNVLGTFLLSVLLGHRRYAHIQAIRFDVVNPPLLGMTKVVSSCSALRAFKNGEESACLQWLEAHVARCTMGLFCEPWILDVDTHVNVLFGHQEGAVLGYNPKKPGRPSRVLHTYFMAGTRLVLDLEVRPGNQTAAAYTMPGLWAYLERLPQSLWPMFLRGDCAFGTEGAMVGAEERFVKYLFKLRQTAKAKRLIAQVFARTDWVDAGKGWEGIEDSLRLSGWTRERRVIVLRRPVDKTVPKKELAQLSYGQLNLIEIGADAPAYEYAILVTNLDYEIATLAQHYRDRGDAENVYDETVNQWAWGGYTTRDLKRTRIMALIVALVYNWWSLFVRLAIPERHAEAATSRPLLLHGVARQTTHAGQTTITITSTHAQTQSIQQVLSRLADFLNGIRATASQLTWEERWRMILSKIFEHLLCGRPLGEHSMQLVPG